MKSIPTPRLHKTGQAYVKWQGKCKYFGKYGTPEANEKYRLWVLSLYGNKSTESTSPLVIDLIRDYTAAHPSKNLKHHLKAINDLGPLSGHRCHEYTPLVFRRHRDIVASTGKRCARHVNDLMRLVQRIFRWGVSMEMVGLTTYESLKTVPPLKADEVEHQATKRKPAKREDVMRAIEELSPVPRAIVLLILYTGARPGEICGMRTGEISKDGPNQTWVFRPGKHKTLHHGKRRFIVFGPKSQKILADHWPDNLLATNLATKNTKNSLQNDGHQQILATKPATSYLFPSSLIVGHYQPASLRQAVWHACKRAGVAPFSPYSLRHLRLTELATDKGLDVAAMVAGHGEQETTRMYQHEPDILQLKGAV